VFVQISSALSRQIRTSSGRFIPNHEHPSVMRIASRVANLTRSDVQWAEDMQVIHYEPMQHYHAHYDYIDHSYEIVANRYPYDNRYVTVLFYLSDVEKGGGTVFPMTNPQWDGYLHGYGHIVCDENFPALRVQPKKGNAVIFYNMDEAQHPYGLKDEFSLHGGCDPIIGDKVFALGSMFVDFLINCVYSGQQTTGYITTIGTILHRQIFLTIRNPHAATQWLLKKH
jgi:prolyl 4-hydroxylase